MTSSPCFITKPDDVEKLRWNSFCFNNLAVYLPRFFIPQPRRREEVIPPRIGILAKGCDARSIVGLIKEHQIPRDNIFILGVACEGIVDRNKMESSIEIVEAQEEDGKIIIVDENEEKTEARKEDLLADACLSCQYPAPLVYDALIGNPQVTEDKEIEKGDPPVIEEFEGKTIEERWKYFEEQMSKCIRCYACRQACPNCYCKECFAEQIKPKWIGVTNDLSDIMLYQIGRIFHQAGRCVDCGACVRACPMGIDLRTFTYKLVKDVRELFGYEAGISLDELPPLTTFMLEDKQEFITEP